MLGTLNSVPEIIGNVAGTSGGGIYTSDYARLRIAPNAKIGGEGLEANTAATSSNLYKTQLVYKAIAQSPFTPPVGVYSSWGRFYSTDADHPLNNYDINPVGSVYRYLVYEDDILKTSKQYLADAVTECATTGTWTIVATEDDDDVSVTGSKPVVIPIYKTIKLTSDSTCRTLKAPKAVHITVYGKLIMENIILDGANYSGGVYVDKGTLEMAEDAVLQNCYSTYNGGGILVSGGTLTLNGGKIMGNIAKHNGGGVYLSNGSNFTMNDGSITSNQATYNGAGVSVVGSTFLMEDGLIDNNETTAGISNGNGTGGGGVYLSHEGDRNGVFTMNGGTISKNKAYDYGGGIYASNGTTTTNSSVTINGGLITENKTTWLELGKGGGIALGNYSQFDLTKEGAIKKNESSGTGGGVYASKTVFTMEGGSITGNKALGYGGGVFLSDKCNFTMSGGKIDENILTSGYFGFGGGVYLSDECNFTMSYGEIEKNIITSNRHSYGGGIYLSRTSGIMTGGTITGNEAKNYGGGIYVYYEADFTLKGDGVIENNNAGFGGGVEVDGTAAFTMSGGTIKGNTAGVDGGGILLRRNLNNDQLASAALIMTGGTISCNTAESGSGGGVHVSDGSVFTMEGGSITGNKAKEGGGIYTNSYENLSITANVEFGKVGTSSANIAATPSDYYPLRVDFENALQTRFATLDPVGKVGIYTDWAPKYSNSANHPVNGIDINVITKTVTVSYIDEKSPPSALTAGPPISAKYKTYTVGEGAPFSLEDIPVIKNYPLKGWVEDLVTSPLKTTQVYISSVTSNKNIYLIYQTTTSLTVSNTVEGPYALKSKLFEYTVYLRDSEGALLPGTKMFNTIITTPGQTPETFSSTLTLNQNGSAMFKLKHGQQIEILGVPLDAKFRIVQTVADDYDTSYTDNIDPDAEVKSNDTSPGKSNQDMLLLSVNRKISFKNIMDPVSDTGVESHVLDLFGLSMIAGTGGFAYAIHAYHIRKLKRSLIWKRLIADCEKEPKTP